jgi:hypothetical protein
MNETKAAELIEADKPLIGLKGYFHNGLDALNYFASEMGRRFERDKVTTKCFSCGYAPVSKVEGFFWRAKVHPKLVFTWYEVLLVLALTFIFRIEHTVVSFSTFHGFCESCAAKARRRRILSVLIRLSTLLTLCFCIGMTVIASLAAIFLKADPSDRNLWLKIALVGLAGVVASSLSQIWAHRLRIPSSLRRIGRRPFDLVVVGDVES